MSWIYLGIAGLLEIAFAFGMKWSAGFTRPLPGALTAVTGIASIYLLSVSLRTLPIGTAYAVWTGIGAVGTALIGVFFLGDSAAPLRLLCIAVIICGVMGLKLVSAS
jgi:quaternary ammonium compound-resistance protein SugE